MPEWDVAEQTTGQAQPLQAAFGGPSDVAGVEECGGAADASVVGPWEAWGQRDHGHEPWAAAAWGTAYHQHHTAKSTAGEGRSGFVVGEGEGEAHECRHGVDASPGVSVLASGQQEVPASCLARLEGHVCNDSRGGKVAVVAVDAAVAVAAAGADAIGLTDAEDDEWSLLYASKGSGKATVVAAGRWATTGYVYVPRRVGGRVNVTPPFRDGAV